MVQSSSRTAAPPSAYQTPDDSNNRSSPPHSHSTSTSTSSATGGKFAGDEPSFYGAVVDQLHAEQKSTIEALSGQVAFYRQREERYKKEVDTLRKYVAKSSSSSHSNNDGADDHSSSTSDAKAHAFAALAAENRALGDELDAWRGRQRAWDADRQRLERARSDAESQLRDAKLSLASLSQAIEQLELKMQRQEAQEQTRCLELEQQLAAKTLECERLADESRAALRTSQNLQAASAETQRLRAELLALTQASALHKSAADVAGTRVQSLETRREELERSVAELQQQLATARLDAGTAQSRVSELQLQLDSANNLLALREKLLASEDHARKDGETQRQELLALVTALQSEKEALKGDTVAQRKELEELRTELQTAKARLSAKDHGVLVSTLRSEISYLKERLRNEFKHEKDELRSEKVALTQEIAQLNERIADKEQFVQRLQREILERDEKNKQLLFDAVHLRERVSSLESSLESARTKYQQLQDCRTAIAEKLDVGFKQLLDDEDSAAAAREELEMLRNEVAHLKKRIAVIDAQRQSAVDELERVRAASSETRSQLNAKIDELSEALRAKEDEVMGLRRYEQQMVLTDRERVSWEQQLEDTRARWQRSVEAEARKADDLRDRIREGEQERAALCAELEGVRQELRVREEQVQASVVEVQQRELELEAGRQEAHRLQEAIARLEDRLQEAAKAVESGRHERSSREKKLLRERKQMEAEMAQLFSRIEAAGTRNVELGEKVVALVNQSKVDQTDLVALSSQLKAYRRRIRHLEEQLSQSNQSSVRESASLQELQQRLMNAEALVGSHQTETSQLRTLVEQVRSEKEVLQKQRDEAVKRVRLLMQCQEQMKATVEGHTAELVEEIEAIQDQLEAERKRCTVLLSNEKALLRDLNERNAAISKLQRSVQTLQQQQQQHPQSPQHHSKNAYDTNKSSSRSPTTATTGSPRDTVASSPRRTQQKRLTSPESTPAKELENILANLERISTFSAQQQQQQHQLRY